MNSLSRLSLSIVRSLFGNMQKILLFALVEIIVFVAYSRIFSGFFQQDEWLSFGYRFSASDGLTGVLRDALTLSVGHYQPLTTLVIQGLFSLFELNYLGYAAVSIALHLISVALVFFLAETISRNKMVSLLSALLFGVTAASYQATSWVLADIGIHFSTIFALLSLISFFNFLKKNKVVFFTLSLIFLITSLLFKESGIGLFLLLPVTFFLFAQERLKKGRKYPIIIAVVCLIYLSFRVSMFFAPQAYTRDKLVIQSQSFGSLVYNIFTFPLKGIAQTIIPSNALLNTSYLISDFTLKDRLRVKDIAEYNRFIQEKVFETASLLSAVGIIFLTIVTFFRNRYSTRGRVIIFSLLLILLNTPVFALAPERSGRIFIIDSRNLYFVSVGASLLVVSFITSFGKASLTRTFAIIMSIIFFNIFWLNKELEVLVKSSRLRENILTQIINERPDISRKAMFYTESDRTYYGLSPWERILPFQSGFGQTLLVWYQPTEDFPKSFFQDRFLWEITDQGYKEFNGRGFGYFRDFTLLAETVEKNKIRPDSVFAFRYRSDTNTLEDMTREVRGRLAGFLADKREVNPRLFVASPSIHTEDTRLMFDRKRETFWNSEVPYATSQTIDIDLQDSRKIAQARVDSYNNKDQNEVGYEVSTSQDGKDWRVVFYAKPYPPGDDGYVDLFLEPQLARFVRIQQIGFHQYATWVVHELRVYEAIN